MSSELERLLRLIRETLPEPEQVVTRRARAHALQAAGRRPRRLPLALGAALLGACAIGVGLGAVLTPSGTASNVPAGLGFLPERGWDVFQSGREATPARPATAVAANVPLDVQDAADGLPYSTLLTLPRDGVVITVGFTVGGDPWRDRYFTPRSLPLRIRDAAPFIEWGAQARPARPLGQYQLRAGVNGHNVDVHLYFGTERPSVALRSIAQRQLDRLFVGSPASTERQENSPRQLSPSSANAAAATPGRTVDRTLLCSTVSVFGDRFARVGASSAVPSVSYPAGAFVGTGAAGTTESLAGVEEGPSSGRTTGNVYFNRKRCRDVRATVPLTPIGLPGPPVIFSQLLRCRSARVLVRMRAVLDRPVRWRVGGQARELLLARGNLSSAALAVRTEAGKPLAFVSIRAGKLKQYTSGACSRD